MLKPQHSTVPSVSTAHESWKFVAILVAVVMPDINTGMELSTIWPSAKSEPDTFDVENRRGIDDAADWDVIVCAHEDVPEVYVRGSTSGSNPGPSGGKTRTHPLWDYDFVGPVTKDGDEAAENKQVKNGIRWRRLIVDEPQELDFTWRLNRYSGNGAWLTAVLNAKHRWALTATPYVTGDGARDVASLTFGTVSVFSYSFYVLTFEGMCQLSKACFV